MAGSDADFGALFRRALIDDEGREALLRALEPRVRGYVRRRLAHSAQGESSDVDDIVQVVLFEFFLRLPGLADDFDEPDLLAYVFQLARWRLGDRGQERRRRIGITDFSDELPASSQTRTGVVTRADDLRRLRSLIDGLPDHYAAVLQACDIEGRGLSEVAEELGIAPETAKKRRTRARQMIMHAASRRDENRDA